MPFFFGGKDASSPIRSKLQPIGPFALGFVSRERHAAAPFVAPRSSICSGLFDRGLQSDLRSLVCMSVCPDI